jgi:DHA1 family bicyclomycin/chloramphenicol resistance-like MFS transporter
MLKDIPRRFYYVAFFFVIYGVSRSMLAPFFPEYVKSIAGNLGILGIIFAIPSVMAAIFDIPFGDLTDHVGRKRLMMLAVVIAIITVISFIFIRDVGTLVVVEIFVGIGGAMLWVPGRAMTKDLLKKRVATEEMALFQVFLNIALMGSVLGGYFAGKFGYNWAFLFSAILAVVALVFLKKKVHETRKQKKRYFKASKDVLFSLKEYFKDIRWFLHQSKSLTAIFIIGAVLYAWYAISAAFIPLYIFQKFNADLYTIGIAMTIINIPFMTVGYYFGRIADKIGEWKMIGIGLLVSGIFVMSIFFSTSVLVFVLLGILASIGNTVLEPLIESVSGKHVTAQRRGRLSAIVNAGKDTGAIIGVVLAGFVAQEVGIGSIFLLSGVSFFICYGILLLWKKIR